MFEIEKDAMDQVVDQEEVPLARVVSRKETEYRARGVARDTIRVRRA